MNPKLRLKYRPEVDGLRAVAVLPVILFHAGFKWMSGGYVGVDIFFVISGYLITSIIINDLQAGSFSIVHFYERRARRILPALFTVILCCLPFAYFWMTPELLKEFSHSLIAVSLFASNVLFARTSGYFDVAAELKPLLHTWSLGVEEQYYVFFPVLMAICWRFGKRNIVKATVVFALLSLAFSELQWRTGHATDGFYLIPTRMWELLVGSIVALTSQFGLLHQKISTRLNNAFTLAGMGLMLFGIFIYDASTPFPSLYALAPVLGAASILVFATKETIAGKFLSLKPIVGIGLISYSAYLWHYPIFALTRIHFAEQSGFAISLLLIMLCFFLAYLSWRFVETPFRKPQLIGRRSIFMGSAIGLIALSVIGYAGHKSDGFREAYIARLSDSQRARFRAIEVAMDSPSFDNGSCKFRESNVTPEFEARFAGCAKQFGQAVLVLGDSHAIDIFNSLAKVSKKEFVVGISKAGCRPHTATSGCHYEGALEFIEKHKSQISSVLYNQKGSYFLTDYKTLPLNEDFIKKTQEFIGRIAKSVTVIWVGPNAEPNIDLRLIHGQLKEIPADGKKLENQNISALDTRLIEAAKRQKYRYLSSYQIVSYDFDRDYIVDGKITYSDKDHWSAFGEEYFGQKLFNAAGSDL